MDTMINVDGRITKPEEAVVPVLDRGFLYGDSVYEVLWWHRGVLVQVDEHLDRLRESARRLYMELGFTDAELVAAVEATCRASGVPADGDAYVRLVVTRGVGALGLAFQDGGRHGLVVIVAPANRPTSSEFEQGLRVQVVERRRNPRVALDPRAKTGNYLNNLLALHEARLAGADEALMLNERGEVTEATTANVYLVRGEGLVTPPLEAGILKGTTRTRILDLARQHGVPVAETVLRPDDLLVADEIFTSSSVKGIRAVVAIDGQVIGDGRPGPRTRALRGWFEAAADAEAEAYTAARDVRS